MSDDLEGKFSREHKADFYNRWVKSQGLEIISAHYVPDLHSVELRPWARRGGSGVFINHEASASSNDCYVCEIPRGGKLERQRQLYEEMIYILDGRGSTTVSNDNGQKVSFEWQEGSLFAIPLNTWHQHFNSSGLKPAKFVAVTNAPLVMNLYEDTNFVFNTPYEFKDRFFGEYDYFEPKNTTKGFLLETNFVADAKSLPLINAKERGADGGHIRFNLSKSTMNAHISQFAVGTYKKGHRHGPGAHVIILGGKGYTLMWPEGEKPQRYDWKEGTMTVPPNLWFHQHFNTGSEPARYLALKYEGTAIRNAQGVPLAWVSRRKGGDQIDYADEDPMIRKMYEEELARNRIESKMMTQYENELANLGQ
ncbi:MAG: cupin domain-containing protein [Nitrososphaerales archaeon]